LLHRLLERLGWKKESVDVWELNEAFAAQWLACIKLLDLDPASVNPRGGSIALGHPIGCSGTRILVNLDYHMQATSARRGIAALRIAGGMGCLGTRSGLKSTR